MTLLPGDQKVKRLYKYWGEGKHTYKNLKKGQLYFSTPNRFNDPFDCRPRVVFDGTNADWIRWLNEQHLKPHEKQIMKQYLQDNDYDGARFLLHSRNKEINSLLVLSLSELNNHILMWSHYAQYHQGICLGFDTKIEGNSLGLLFSEVDHEFRVKGITPGFLPVRKVKYSENMPDVYNRLHDSDHKLMEFTVTKQADWHYEKERRIVIPKGLVKSDSLGYRKEILSEVIFGMRCSKDTRSRVKKIIKKHFPDSGKSIRFFKAIAVEDRYALEIHPL